LKFGIYIAFSVGTSKRITSYEKFKQGDKMQFLSKATIKATFILYAIIFLFTPSITQALTLTDSPPIVVTANGQIIENVRIVANNTPAIRVSGFSGVIIRNVEILHKGDHGIRCSNAPDLTIKYVSITHTGTATPNAKNSINIACEFSDRLTVNHVRLEGGSAGVYINNGKDAKLQFIEGYNFRGPFPSGQLAQFNTSDNCLLEDFSAINDLDTSISWTEDNVSVFNSDNCVVRRGLLDGNNSPSGVGLMFEHSNNGLVVDVDTVRQGNGTFSAYPGTNITFRRTRARDNICTDMGRGLPLSGGLAWTGSSSSVNLKVEDSHYYNLCGGLIWNRTSFPVIELSSDNFQPRSPIVNKFPWEDGKGANANFTTRISDLTVDFTDLSTSDAGSILNWFWEFGDGGVSTRANPSHTYSVGGTYTVSLTVTDRDGDTDSGSLNVTVVENQAPTAGFTSSTSGLKVNFNNASFDSDGIISKILWKFGDGRTSTNGNPSRTYSSPGTYTVSLTVTDNDGASDTFSRSVTVIGQNQAPTAGFTSSTSGLKVNFNNASFDSDGSISKILWKFGDGRTSTNGNPSRTYSSPGTYTVSLTVTDNDGASDTFSRSVTVIGQNQAPTAGFTSSTSGLKVNFNNASFDSDGSISKILWKFGDGRTSTNGNPSRTYSSPGTYTVSLTVTDNEGASDTFSRSVTVIDLDEDPEDSNLHCFLYGCN
jgi:PKD repeat protein